MTGSDAAKFSQCTEKKSFSQGASVFFVFFFPSSKVHQVASISLKGAELSAVAAPRFNTEQNAVRASAKGSDKLRRRSKTHFLFSGWGSGTETASAWKAFGPFFL